MTTRQVFKDMRYEMRTLKRMVRFAEGVISDLAKIDPRNCDITNVYWMERRRVAALVRKRKELKHGQK